MHRNVELFKQHRCLICFKTIHHPSFLIEFIADPVLCKDCFKQFSIYFSKENLNDLTIQFLYRYNDFFKSLLFRYKGQYDLALAPVFCYPFYFEITQKYRDYIIVPCPSSFLQNEKRGFAPMLEIAKTLRLPIFVGLYKKQEYKQSDQSYANRKNVYDVIDIQDPHLLTGKKVLLIDDVMTSGHTIQACVNCIKKGHPSKIEILVLAKR